MGYEIFDDFEEEVVVIDRNFRIVYANRKYAQDLGYSSPREVIGDFCYVVSHHRTEPCDGECHPCPIAEIEKRGGSVNVVHTHYTHDNHEVPVEILAFPIENGEKTLQIIRNIKDYKEKYYLFSLSQKLSSVGYLAMGIAHQISTPLGTILLALDELERKSGSQEEIETIRSAVNTCKEYVDKLLLMVRRKATEDIIDISKAVRDTVDILQMYSKDRGVRIECNPSEPIYVMGNEADIRHVLLNIILNAIQASPQGGKVEVSLRKEESQVSIEVKDEGEGIPPEDLGKIFMPFYTGKNKKEGTGLGLAIASGIVKDYGGSINVLSTPGEGTTFRVNLPVS